MLRAMHFLPLPCSDLERGVAMIITAFTKATRRGTPFRFFVFLSQNRRIAMCHPFVTPLR